MRKKYFGVFYRDALHPWTCASLASIAKSLAIEESGYKTWHRMKLAGYRLGRLRITEIAPEPKKGAK